MVQAKALKLSEYKDVFQVSCSDGTKHIVKTFKGWAKVHCHNNAKYTLNAIQLLSSHLTCARLPAWAELSDDDVSVQMELLPELFKGQEVFPQDYELLSQFFTELYQITCIPGWIKDIRESKVIPAHILDSITADQPMALGFKGDAWGNVLLSEQQLVLADVEDICSEPLGFSEVIALLEMSSAVTSGKPRALVGFFYFKHVKPAFINFLTKEQSLHVIELARAAWEERVASCGRFRKYCKVEIADRVVQKLHIMLDENQPQEAA